jgi:hypothetical protein
VVGYLTMKGDVEREMQLTDKKEAGVFGQTAK